MTKSKYIYICTIHRLGHIQADTQPKALYLRPAVSFRPRKWRHSISFRSLNWYRQENRCQNIYESSFSCFPWRLATKISAHYFIQEWSLSIDLIGRWPNRLCLSRMEGSCHNISPGIGRTKSTEQSGHVVLHRHGWIYRTSRAAGYVVRRMIY